MHDFDAPIWKFKYLKYFYTQPVVLNSLKKLFAILMTLVILFNAGGYDLFFQYLIYRSDSQTFETINHSRYKSSDLVEVKIPVVMPAQAPQEYTGEYEKVSGQIQIKNDKYDYAEIKITKDTLYLSVIPNPEINKLAKANVLYGKLINDQSASNNKHSNNPLTKKSSSESILLSLNYMHPSQADIAKKHYSCTVAGIIKTSLEIGGQPPEA